MEKIIGESCIFIGGAPARWTRQEKIVFADVCSVWSFVLKRKGFFALTGNGVNHPNDFGHSLYAKTILSVLGCRC